MAAASSNTDLETAKNEAEAVKTQLTSAYETASAQLSEANRKVAEVETELSVANTTIVSLRQQVLDSAAECEEKRLALESAQQASQQALESAQQESQSNADKSEALEAQLNEMKTNLEASVCFMMKYSTGHGRYLIL